MTVIYYRITQMHVRTIMYCLKGHFKFWKSSLGCSLKSQIHIFFFNSFQYRLVEFDERQRYKDQQTA